MLSDEQNISQRLVFSILNDSIKKSQLFWRLSAGESLSQMHVIKTNFLFVWKATSCEEINGGKAIGEASGKDDRSLKR